MPEKFLDFLQDNERIFVQGYLALKTDTERFEDMRLHLTFSERLGRKSTSKASDSTPSSGSVQDPTKIYVPTASTPADRRFPPSRYLKTRNMFIRSR